jgi:hypothetical protein
VLGLLPVIGAVVGDVQRLVDQRVDATRVKKLVAALRSAERARSR